MAWRWSVGGSLLGLWGWERGSLIAVVFLRGSLIAVVFVREVLILVGFFFQDRSGVPESIAHPAGDVFRSEGQDLLTPADGTEDPALGPGDPEGPIDHPGRIPELHPNQMPPGGIHTTGHGHIDLTLEVGFA
jgi:hypothetical protein